ncbi:SixA phosphatase family protein [Gracilimonas halophila]|uniref:SixA phosphatase family protein n=1 Tax=Gracilimonas halophila TaxID=1834464 RepID=A0ABW5JJK6_9BACT
MKKITCLLLLILFTLPAFAQVNSQTNTETTLIFVRHAEKQDDGTRDPSLTEIGEKRAQKLSELITSSYNVSAIYSTGYKRTQQTAFPTSEVLNLSINEYQLSNPDSLIRSIIELHKGEHVLIVGHSNSTPTLVNAAINENRFEKLDESVYDNIFEVNIDETGETSVNRYTYWTQGKE